MPATTTTRNPQYKHPQSHYDGSPHEYNQRGNSRHYPSSHLRSSDPYNYNENYRHPEERINRRTNSTEYLPQKNYWSTNSNQRYPHYSQQSYAQHSLHQDPNLKSYNVPPSQHSPISHPHPQQRGVQMHSQGHPLRNGSREKYQTEAMRSYPPHPHARPQTLNSPATPLNESLDSQHIKEYENCINLKLQARMEYLNSTVKYQFILGESEKLVTEIDSLERKMEAIRSKRELIEKKLSELEENQNSNTTEDV